MAGPLEGIRILDLTQVLFGPFATMILNELGVEVIKVKRPEVGDIARGWQRSKSEPGQSVNGWRHPAARPYSLRLAAPGRTDILRVSLTS